LVGEADLSDSDDHSSKSIKQKNRPRFLTQDIILNKHSPAAEAFVREASLEDEIEEVMGRKDIKEAYGVKNNDQ